MGTGFRGAYVVAWAQTRLEGFPAQEEQPMAEGMIWRWHGRALPLEGDGAALVLTASRETDDLRSRAARVVRKLLQRPASGPADLATAALDDDDPLFSGAFILSDGVRFFTAVPITVTDGAPPVLLFPDVLPVPDRDHTVIACNDRMRPVPRSGTAAVICFTPGTRIATADGTVAVEDLGPGYEVLTRDSGPQPVVWTGNCRMSGARLFAMPDQRPVRIRAGALGTDRPREDLIVSPEHRVLITGRACRDLWGEEEVLVRAADLVGDRAVSIDQSLRETYYIHLMLERHHIVWANGLAVDSFHPAYMGLDQLSGLQRSCLHECRPDIAVDPFRYGAPARRMVDQAEAAILLGGGASRPLSAARRAQTRVSGWH